MFDDNAHEKRRAARVLLEKERAATFLATLVPMFEAAGFKENGGNDQISVYTKFLTAPWQVEIFMDEGSVHENDALDPTYPVWMVWASPDGAYEDKHAPGASVSIPVPFGASRLHAIDALRVAEEIAELIEFMVTKPKPRALGRRSTTVDSRNAPRRALRQPATLPQRGDAPLYIAA